MLNQCIAGTGRDAAMNVERKLLKQEEAGDHTMFVGEVVEISANENIKLLIYHNGKYRQIGEDIHKPQIMY